MVLIYQNIHDYSPTHDEYWTNARQSQERRFWIAQILMLFSDAGHEQHHNSRGQIPNPRAAERTFSQSIRVTSYICTTRARRLMSHTMMTTVLLVASRLSNEMPARSVLCIRTLKTPLTTWNTGAKQVSESQASPLRQHMD